MATFTRSTQFGPASLTFSFDDVVNAMATIPALLSVG